MVKWASVARRVVRKVDDHRQTLSIVMYYVK